MLAAFLLGLCAFNGSARAAERMKVGFMLDIVNGVAIPIADSDYKKYVDPSYKLGLRIGPVLYLHRWFGIAPEFDFDFIPVNSNDGTFQNNGIDAQFYRERGLLGARFIFHFNIGSVYLRTVLGVDHIGGTTSAGPPGFRASVDWGSTGFTIEPSLGVQFNVVRHLVLGFSTGFPIAWHDFSTENATVNNILRTYGLNPHFTAVDLDLLFVIGIRL
jgi:hypothetical protein